MPSKPGRDDEVFVKLFVSAYENFAWKDSHICWVDQEKDSAVEALATRSDGKTMAIEHTLIEPFVGDKSDFASFEQSLEALRNDHSLPIPNAGIEIYIPVGTMAGQKQSKRDLIVKSVRAWISANRLQLREGEHRYECEVPGEPKIELTVKFKPWRAAKPTPGIRVPPGREETALAPPINALPLRQMQEGLSNVMRRRYREPFLCNAVVRNLRFCRA